MQNNFLPALILVPTIIFTAMTVIGGIKNKEKLIWGGFFSLSLFFASLFLGAIWKFACPSIPIIKILLNIILLEILGAFPSLGLYYIFRGKSRKGFLILHAEIIIIIIIIIFKFCIS